VVIHGNDNFRHAQAKPLHLMGIAESMVCRKMRRWILVIRAAKEGGIRKGWSGPSSMIPRRQRDRNGFTGRFSIKEVDHEIRDLTKEPKTLVRHLVQVA